MARTGRRKVKRPRGRESDTECLVWERRAILRPNSQQPVGICAFRRAIYVSNSIFLSFGSGLQFNYSLTYSLIVRVLISYLTQFNHKSLKLQEVEARRKSPRIGHRSSLGYNSLFYVKVFPASNTFESTLSPFSYTTYLPTTCL